PILTIIANKYYTFYIKTLLHMSKNQPSPKNNYFICPFTIFLNLAIKDHNFCEELTYLVTNLSIPLLAYFLNLSPSKIPKKFSKEFIVFLSNLDVNIKER